MAKNTWFGAPGTVAALLATVALVTTANSAVNQYKKPPRPVTGAPAWSAKFDPEVEEQKLKAVRLYMKAGAEVERAREDLNEAAHIRAASGSDPRAAKRATKQEAEARKKLTRARDRYTRVTALDPESADGWNMLGFTRSRLGDQRGAFEAFRKCLSLNPNHCPAHENEGEAYLLEGKLDDARSELQWLKRMGNRATLETGHLTMAIDQWEATHPGAATKPD